MGTLLMWLPNEAMILVIAGVGLALIVGLIRVRTAMAIVGTVILSLLLSPFIDSLFASLPRWVSLLILFLVVMSLLRGISTLLLGERAAGHMVGSLAADVVRFLLRLLLFPFWILRWAFRRT